MATPSLLAWQPGKRAQFRFARFEIRFSKEQTPPDARLRPATSLILEFRRSERDRVSPEIAVVLVALILNSIFA
jgi:hypothetical protein